MKAHKVTLFIIDFDECGADEIKVIIENQKYPNHCINPDVKNIETVDVGQWYDEHPLNKMDTCEAEYKRLFTPNPQQDW